MPRQDIFVWAFFFAYFFTQRRKGAKRLSIDRTLIVMIDAD